MEKNNVKKSMIFIDGSNLLSSFRSYCYVNNHTQVDKQTNKIIFTKKINYENLIKQVINETDFIRGYYYDAIPEPIGDKKQSFFDMLHCNGITIVTKKLKYKSIQCRHCNKKDDNVPYQKGVDVSLVTDVMNLAFEKAYDIAIVISGDNDFVEAINYVKRKGPNIWVASFINSLGQDLMRSADKVIHLDKIFDKITEPITNPENHQKV